MKLLLLFALVVGCSNTLPAQHLERAVTGSAGDYQSHPTVGNLHWTVGEIAVEEFQNGQALSQGFQQAYTIDVISAIDDEKSERIQVKIFPNPSSGWIQVETDLPGKLDVVLTDLLGQHLFTHIAAHTGGIIDLYPLSSGIYVLRVSREGKTIGTFRIVKADN